jgi:hypothetical protein
MRQYWIPAFAGMTLMRCAVSRQYDAFVLDSRFRGDDADAMRRFAAM